MTPTGLNCTGKEGFGIIELEAYNNIYKANKDRPEIYNTMIGFLYRNVAKNMTAVKLNNMVMG